MVTPAVVRPIGMLYSLYRYLYASCMVTALSAERRTESRTMPLSLYCSAKGCPFPHVFKLWRDGRKGHRVDLTLLYSDSPQRYLYMSLSLVLLDIRREIRRSHFNCPSMKKKKKSLLLWKQTNPSTQGCPLSPWESIIEGKWRGLLMQYPAICKRSELSYCILDKKKNTQTHTTTLSPTSVSTDLT